ncbi:MAG: ATP cone domain-containing protein [Limisphaerales bacterium]
MKTKADGQLDFISLVTSQAEDGLAAKSKPPTAPTKPEQVLVVKRDGASEPFDKRRITVALESAFKAVRDIPTDTPMTDSISESVTSLTERISKRILEDAAQGTTLDVEYIQDIVENQLMCDGYLTEARRYILYREDRRKIRAQTPSAPLESPVAPVEETPGTHLLLKVIYEEALPDASSTNNLAASLRRNFSYAIQDAVHNDQLAPELLMFDLEHLSSSLQLDRDQLISRAGVEWLYANCLARECDHSVETPQYFWMRVAMAMAVGEDDREARALEFYEVLSTLRFLPSEKLLRTSGRSSAISNRILADVEDFDASARVAGHVNLAAHIQNGALDELLLYGTISSAVRLLDNAIELANAKLNVAALHAREYREIALGIVGHEKALESLNISAEPDAAMEYVERSAESIAYYATLASATLAAERGSFPGHSDSNWNIGALPFESLKLSQARSGSPDGNYSKDWLAVRAAVRQYGMRNGHILALTPAHVVEKIISDTAPRSSFSAQLNRLVRCRKWVDGRVWITLPEDLSGPDLEQAYLLAQQLGIRPYTLPVRLTISEPFTDAAAATKVLKGIEKSS